MLLHETKNNAKIKQLLDYATTHPDAIITYQASDMILALHSDGSYHPEPDSKSKAGEHFYLTQSGNYNVPNGAVQTLSKVIKYVMSSAGEAEVASSYLNCKAALPLRVALEEMGHPQPPTPVIMDNTTAIGLTQNTMTPKRSKGYDMRMNWLKCREAQTQFNLVWQPGKNNKGDYHSKTHPTHEYVQKRKLFVVD